MAKLGKTLRGLRFPLLYVAVPYIALSAEPPRTDVVNITSTGYAEGMPRAFVFAKGELVGSIPGTMELPEQPGGIPVEVGFSALPQAPVYSFLFGPDQIKSGRLTIVSSDISFGTVNGKADGEIDRGHVVLGNNLQQDVAIGRGSDGEITIALPPSPLTKAAALVGQTLVALRGRVEIRDAPRKIASNPSEPSDAASLFFMGAKHVNALAVVAISTNLSKNLPPYHLSYDKEQDSIRDLDASSRVSWFDIDSLLLATQSEDWTIVSDPQGAKVIVRNIESGSTEESLKVIRTGRFSLVLHKEGYMECPYQKCSQVVLKEGQILLSCKLQRIKTSSR
jgi:hypothetical protein